MHQVRLHPLSVPVLRVMLSGIFLVAGASHFFKKEITVQRLENARFGNFALLLGSPDLLVYASGAVMLVGGVLLTMGIKSRMSAGALALVLIPITLTIQIGDPSSVAPLFKNIAILGGLLFFILNEFPNPNKNKK